MSTHVFLSSFEKENKKGMFWDDESATLFHVLYFKPFIDEKYVGYFKCQYTNLEKSRKIRQSLDCHV